MVSILVGHNKFLEPMLIYIMRVNVGHEKISTHTKFLVEN